MIIISCEHGGNKIPAKYAALFKNKSKVLKSHRGWDPGALLLAKKIAKDINAPLIYSETSRLLIDLNRSLHNPKLFSEYSNHCNKTTKQELMNKFYFPYRSKIENKINNNYDKFPVIHFSIHSFTPVLNNITRTADVGLLYDPARKAERDYCATLQKKLKEKFPDLTIRCNYPYKGNADGFTTHLRNQFSEKKYLGIEIEINQKHILNNDNDWKKVKNELGRLLINI